MLQYQDMLRHILTNGVTKADRTGTGTRSVFGYQTRYNLDDGFPLVTTKHTYFRGVAVELLWFLRGGSNIRYLLENGIKIWTPWAYKAYKLDGGQLSVKEFERSIIMDDGFAEVWGELGPIYGKQWRKWDKVEFKHRGTPITPGATWLPATKSGYSMLVEGRYEFSTIDQIDNVIEQIKNDPDDRGMVVTAWNPADLGKMALRPCHCLFQFYTRPMLIHERAVYALKHMNVAINLFNPDLNDLNEQFKKYRVPERYLDCQLYQRSADAFIGVPFNIASYALLTHMIAQVTNTAPGEFIHSIGDLHIYSNHLDHVTLQLTREPRDLPTLDLNYNITNIFDFTLKDIVLVGYDSWPGIRADVAV